MIKEKRMRIPGKRRPGGWFSDPRLNGIILLMANEQENKVLLNNVLANCQLRKFEGIDSRSDEDGGHKGVMDGFNSD